MDFPLSMQSLLERIRQRDASVAVIGLGYVGLPLAVEIADRGFLTMGIDLDTRKIQALNGGQNYSRDVPDETLARLIQSKRLIGSDVFSSLNECHIVCVCIPIPLDPERNPDLTLLMKALTEVRIHLRAGQLILLESTVPPGLTEEKVIPFLEESGLRAGNDFHFAFSPERIDPGNSHYKIHNIPKLVSGTTPPCTELALAFYRSFVQEVLPIPRIGVVELARVLENSFRAVNIAFIHEFSEMCERLGVSVWEVIEAASSKPFGFMSFQPGPGVGGHCVPVAPRYLQWVLGRKGFESRFIKLADEINRGRPKKVIQKAKEGLERHGKTIENSNILVLGVAYKQEVDDFRYSPALEVLQDLRNHGARVSYHDPYIPRIELGRLEFRSENPEGRWSDYDLVVLLTPHRHFHLPSILGKCRLFLDTKNATRGIEGFEEKIIRL